MQRIAMTITFTGRDGASRSESAEVETPYTPDPDGEDRLMHNLLAELKVAVGETPEPKHNATARKWLDFPKRAAGFESYFDIQNSQALWLELSNLILGVEADLAFARAFKDLEPTAETSLDDSRGINRLYYLHDRKMTLLNHAVYGLIKVQDLVNRLLHESLGGELVDIGTPDWEKYELTRKKVSKGLAEKCASDALSQTDFAAISQALELPEKTAKRGMVLGYRNALAHHIRPSVDYSMFFSSLQSRMGEEVRDAEGKAIGRRYAMFPTPPPQYCFKDLHDAFSEYLDATVEMLQKLSDLAILR